MKHKPFGNYIIVEKIDDPLQFDDKLIKAIVRELPAPDMGILIGAEVLLDNAPYIPIREDGKEYCIYRTSNIIAYIQ